MNGDESVHPGVPIERLERLFQALEAAPWKHDFYALLRYLESLAPGSPRLGRAGRPAAELLRLGQDPEMDFAPTALRSFQYNKSTRVRIPPRLGVRFFGLFGPMGPLPLHLTDYARDRLRNHSDPTLARFADVFHHRALLLFYRAWAHSQPAVHADRPAEDGFAKWVSALFGQAPHEFHSADAVPDTAKRFVAAHLARATRHPESISKVLRQYFGVPVRVESNVGHWMELSPGDRSNIRGRLRGGSALGSSAVIGTKVWDRQYKLRLHLGPLTWVQYQQFLPGQRSLIELRDWMRQLLGFEMLWDLRLILRGDEVPGLGFRQAHENVDKLPLGLCTWLGKTATSATPYPHRGDLILQPARL